MSPKDDITLAQAKQIIMSMGSKQSILLLACERSIIPY
jgi:hypothetical protein